MDVGEYQRFLAGLTPELRQRWDEAAAHFGRKFAEGAGQISREQKIEYICPNCERPFITEQPPRGLSVNHGCECHALLEVKHDSVERVAWWQ